MQVDMCGAIPSTSREKEKKNSKHACKWVGMYGVGPCMKREKKMSTKKLCKNMYKRE